ncbi:MAG: KAP P-loop domain-containing protein [Methanohalophilus sp.]|nr:MAG: KAP P-loop domain-containing protein [Methanohalophilus sp.]
MEYINWIADYPIENENENEDLLHVEKVTATLAKMLIFTETPFTLGINGEWGSGKSSIMKLIKQYIDSENNETIHTTWFDTWNYANEKEIWKLLMISLLEDLPSWEKKEADVEQLLTSIINIGTITANTIVSGGLNLVRDHDQIVSFAKDTIKVKRDKEQEILKNKSNSIKYFREEFESVVNRGVGKKGKYIIFIDDLDRVEPNKTIEIIEALKSFLACDKCVFVVGCDYEYLNNCVRQKYNNLNINPESYLEKIIQTTFNIGSINNSQFNVFISNYLNNIFPNSEDFIIATNLINKSIGKNPRKIKRLINSYAIIHNLNHSGIDIVFC